MTTLADDTALMPLLHSPSIHPALRTAAQEIGQLCAMIAGYGALIALCAFMAYSAWSNIPSAVADSQLVPGVSASDTSMKLRGSL